LGRMVLSLLHANNLGRNNIPISLLSWEDHFRIVSILRDNESSLYLHIHDTLACTGQLPFRIGTTRRTETD
jgi:hypothetical protein